MKLTLADVARNYGPDFGSFGVISDSLSAPGLPRVATHVSPSGTVWIRPESGGRAFRLLCGEVITARTPEGITDGRCGQPVVYPSVCCEGHTDLHEAHGTSVTLDEYADRD